MDGGNWSVLELPGDPVRGEPAEVRSLGEASQQQAKLWEEQAESLRTLANDGDAMEMTGDFAPRYRQQLRSHPEGATPLARGRMEAGAALLAYAGQLEQAKRQSQMALNQGIQAKQAYNRAMQMYEQASAELASLPRLVPPEQLAYYQQLYYRLEAQQRQAWQMAQQAEAQWKAARQQAVQAGEWATEQEGVAAEKLAAAAPANRVNAGSSQG
jgi:hypothetical protein